MLNSEFQKAEKIYPFDRLLAATVLKLIPRRIHPNHITVLRFILTPIVVILMFKESYHFGLWAFLITAFTDAIDGAMARTRDQITEWGKVYDPVADKILIGAMVFIIVLRYLDPWTALIIIFLETIIITVGWVRLKTGTRIQANVWGKVKMILQVAGVIILLLAIVFDWATLFPLASGTLYLAIAFAIVSLLTYGI